MKQLLSILAVLILSLVSLEARDKQVTLAAPSATVEAPKKGIIPFFRKLFRRPEAEQPQAAVEVRPKPKPSAVTVARRASGSRSTQTASATTRPSAVVAASQAPKPPVAAKAPEKVAEKPADVLSVPPAPAPVSTAAQRAEYSESSTLGKAMRTQFEALEVQSAEPTRVVEETLTARVTAYADGDANSEAKKSSTHVPLQEATPTKIGVAAGPAELLGSYVIVERGGKKYRYLIADTGTAVEKKTASGGKAPVIDLYHEDGQEWPDYQKVVVVKITGASNMLLHRPSVRDEFLDPEVFRKARTLARRS